MTGDNGYQSFSVFAPIFSSVTLDNNKKLTSWISTGYHPENLNHLIVNLNYHV